MLHDVPRRATAVALFSLAAILPSQAHARPKSTLAPACAKAAEEGQQERDAGQLLNARESFVACSAEQCPKEVRTDCQRWAEELRPIIPSVLIAVQTSQGQDVTRYALRIDGEIVVPAPGRPVELDPGVHEFHVSADNMMTSVSKFTAHEGEQRRMVRIALNHEVGRLPGQLTDPPSGTTPPPPSAFATPLAYGVTALGGALAITGVALYAVTTARANEVDAECQALGANCEVQNRDTLGTRKTWGAVLTLTGVATLGAGLYLLLSGRPASTPTLALGSFQ